MILVTIVAEKKRAIHTVDDCWVAAVTRGNVLFHANAKVAQTATRRVIICDDLLYNSELNRMIGLAPRRFKTVQLQS